MMTTMQDEFWGVPWSDFDAITPNGIGFIDDWDSNTFEWQPSECNIEQATPTHSAIALQSSSLLHGQTARAEHCQTISAPSNAQWEGHRQIITQLYYVQNEPLQRVKLHMELKHNFYASDKMYKIRITKWGLDKKFKRHEATAMLKLLSYYEAVDLVPKFIVRGREINLLDLKRYARRANITSRELNSIRTREAYQRAPQVACRFESMSMVYINSPDCFQYYELLQYTIASYVHGAFDAKMCWQSPYSGLIWREESSQSPIKFLDLFATAICQQNDKGNWSRSMFAWRMAFLKAESMKNEPDPLMWLKLISSRLDCIKTGFNDMGTALCRHIFALIGFRLSCVCPHRSLAKMVCHMTSEQLEPSLHFYGKVLFHALRSFLTLAATVAHMCHLATFSDRRLFADDFWIDMLDNELSRLERSTLNDTELLDLLNLYGVKLMQYRHLRDYHKIRDVYQSMHDVSRKLASEFDSDSWEVYLTMYAADDSRFARNYEEAKSGYMAAIELGQRFEKRHNYILLDPATLYPLYRDIERCSRFSEVADDDQPWKTGIQTIEEIWERELSEAVGDLSLGMPPMEEQ